MAVSVQDDPPDPPRALAVQKVALLYTPRITAAEELGRDLEEWLTHLGVSVWRGPAHEACALPPEALADCGLLFTLGGDGTALRGARVAARTGVPLVCVGLGRLSFMAELTPADVLKQLPRLLSGDYWLEERAMLEGVVYRGEEELTRTLALNEVCVGRERTALSLRVDVRVDGAPLTTYTADAVLVASATGSTAYALSAGGPILYPESRCLLLLPVAAHLCLLPPLVLPEETVVEFEIATDSACGVSADGQNVLSLKEGDRVQVRRSGVSCRFARLQGRDYFFRTLKARLMRQEARSA